ncbi:glutathione S-transferase family protein [Acidisoma cladoniae]|jgi:glutathione S-transferase|uniref:glutathione S-transferase family protein n=1 Tax=Acidisoma cladoniae TaxID=3040935 RepID=UPI00254E975B|nr:glutathione S-transferase family protein [Acidisoma sp. PAMC 29798]
MSDGRLVIGTKRYSSWSMRGWLAVACAGLDVTEVLIPLAGGQTSAVKDATPSGLVPYLEHDGARVWESLAIIEYCAEVEPKLWPKGRRARAMARAVAAEMHASFRDLRQAMPMNIGRDDYAGLGQTEGALADIARIEAVWEEARHEFGEDGPFLFGKRFTGADIMFAPVVARLLTYAPPLSDASRAYCDAVRAFPHVDTWYTDAAAEPAAWQLEKYESLR